LTEAVSNEAKAALKEIGLTEYETRAYLHLLHIGATTASKISEEAEVPYSKIYEVLNSLERKGWVEARAGRPRRYYPKSPVEAFEVTRLRLESTMEDWRHSVAEELQPLFERRAIREKPDVWILRGDYDAVAKLKELIGEARSELMVAVPAFTKPLVDVVLPIFNRIINPNVKIMIMLSKDQDTNTSILSQLGEIRKRDSMFGGGVIADGRQALLILGEKKPSLIIWSDHIGLVKFAKDYFQYLWNTAEKI
jgi:sugar-specific transcriptional regulator TrmB